MNGKKAKLLRKLAKMNTTEENQKLGFKDQVKNEFTKVFVLPSDTPNEKGEKSRKVHMTLYQSRTDSRTAGYIYRQMKMTYNQMRQMYKGMKSHKLEEQVNHLEEHVKNDTIQST